MRGRRRRQWECVFAALLAVTGANCASTAPAQARLNDIDKALQVADELEDARAFDPARRQLGAVLPYVSAAEADGLRLRICNLYRLQDDDAAALQCYRGLDASLTRPDDRALAALHAAQLQADAQHPAAAQAAIGRILQTAPATDSARRALVLGQALAREKGGNAAEVRYLLAAATRLEHAWLPDAAAAHRVQRLRAGAVVQAAHVQRVKLHDAAGAVKLLQAQARLWHGTVWADDALIELARGLRATGKLAAAAQAYQRLTATHETSWFVGSYDSQYLDDAWLELGETLEQLGDVAGALHAYHELGAEVPSSRLRDAAAFFAARLQLHRGNKGPMQAFLQHYPESRYVPDARRLVAQP